MQWLKQRGSVWAESGWGRDFFEISFFRLRKRFFADIHFIYRS
jgi:hypothetical protein